MADPRDANAKASKRPPTRPRRMAILTRTLIRFGANGEEPSRCSTRCVRSAVVASDVEVPQDCTAEGAPGALNGQYPLRKCFLTFERDIIAGFAQF